MHKKYSALFFLFILLTSHSIIAQNYTGSDAQRLIKNAEKVRLDNYDKSLKYVKFSEPIQISVNEQDKWLKSFLKVSNNNDYVLTSVQEDRIGQSHYRYAQYFNGVRVETGVFIIHRNANGIISINGEFKDVTNASATPSIRENDALIQALKSVPSKLYKWDDEQSAPPQAELVFLPKSGGIHLAYKFDIYSYDPLARYYVFIDASSGKELIKHDRIQHTDVDATAHTKYHGTQTITTDMVSSLLYKLLDGARSVNTKDLNNSTYYSAAVDFTNTSTVWNTTTNQDDAALDAHFGAEKTYDYFFDTFGLDSYNNSGASINSYVHYGNSYVNAFWDGTQMTYGDGDGYEYTALTSIDVVAHEITHAVTEYSAGLIYSYESGALNESFSDIFGVTIDYYADPTHANWFMGDLFHVLGNGFRDMSDPNAKFDPDTYLGNYWVFGSSDNGGVHTNSGVQNYWYYLLVNGGTGINDNTDSYFVSGIGMDDAAAIAYRNLSYYLVSSSDYEDARFYSIEAAVDLFGTCSIQEISTTNAWYAVGVGDLYENAVSAAFVASQTHSCEIPASISFINLSSNDSARVWDFGDGTTDTSFSPTHIYTSEGEWTVSLIVNGSTSCGLLSDTLIYTNYIITTNTGAPTAACSSFSSGYSNYGIFNVSFNTIDHSTLGAEDGYQDYSCTQSTSVTAGDFIDLSVTTSNANQYVKAYLDANDDGVFESGEEIFSDYAFEIHSGTVHIPEVSSYDSPLRLRIISDVSAISDPCTVSANYSQVEDYAVLVSEVDSPPIANLTADETTINVGSSVNFTDLSTGLPTSWEWSFPGGTPSSSDLQNPSVSYPVIGNYDVQLIVQNAFGSDTILFTDYIQVSNSFMMCGPTSVSNASSGLLYDSGGPSGNYSDGENCYLLIEPSCADSIILSFTSFSVEGGYDYLRVYDGTSSSDPEILYASGSSVPSQVIATSGAMFIYFHTDGSVTYSGFAANWTTEQYSTETPVAEFDISEINPPLASDVQFTDVSSNDPNEWFWDFGDGSFSAEQNPIHSFSSSGSQTVTLIATTCTDSDTISHEVVVQDPPLLSVNPTSINETIESCVDSISVPLTLYNLGLGDLMIDPSLTTSTYDTLSSLIYYTLSGAATSHLFENIPQQVDAIHVRIKMEGDYNSSSEYATLSIDGVDFGIIEDYGQTSVVYEFDLLEDQLSTFLSDGSLEFILDNSYAVEGTGIYDNSHEVSISYYFQRFIYTEYAAATVGIGDSTIINVVLSASGFIPGTYVDSVAIYSNDLDNSPFYIPISLTNNGTADLALSVNCVLFDTLTQFTTDSAYVEIINAGCDVLELYAISQSSDEYSISASTMTIPAFSSDTIWVYFEPSSVGLIEDSILIESSILDTSICLSGFSYGAPIINVAPDSINVELSACNDSVTVPLMIYNSGLNDLSFSIPSSLSSSGNELTIVSWKYGCDLSINGEYVHTLSAIATYLDNYTIVESETTDPSVLQGLLANADVLLIAEQENYVGSVNSEMAPTIQNFVSSGGWLVRCGTMHTYLNEIGIFNTSSAYNNNNVMTIEDEDSPLLLDVSFPLYGENATFSQDFTNPDIHVVTSNFSNPTIAHLDYGLGKAIYIPFDYYSYNDNTNRIIGNAMEWARINTASWLSFPIDSATVAAGDSVLVDVIISAEGLEAGDYTTSITINANDPTNPVESIPVSLHLEGLPEVSFSADCIAFDTTLQFVSDTASIYVYNSGCDNLIISNIEATHSDVYADTTQLTIAPFDSSQVVFYFTPDSAITYTGDINFTTNVGDTSICFTGNVIGAAQIATNPDSIDVSLYACNDSITIPVTVYNTGLNDLYFIVDHQSGGSTASLNVVSWTYNADIFGEYSNTVQALGGYFSDYTLTAEPFAIYSNMEALLATADVLLIPEVYYSSSLITMAPLFNDFASNGGWIILCGNQDNVINALEIFEVYDSQSFSYGNQIIDIEGSPLLNNVELPISNPDITICKIFLDEDYQSIASNVYNGDTFSSLGYKDIGNGKAVYIANDFYEYEDDQSRILGNILEWYSSENANWISVSDSGTVAPGDSTIINVTIGGEGVFAGDYSGSILIETNDPLNLDYSIPVEFHLSGSPEVLFSSDCLDFDSLMQFTTDTTMLTIYNSGCDYLLVSDIVTSNANLIANSSSFEIAPYDSLTLAFYFTPDSVLNYEGDITFISNAGDTSICFNAVSLGAPAISFSPESLSVSLHCNDSITIPISVYNTGLSELNYSGGINNGSGSGFGLNVVAWTYGADLNSNGEYNNTIDAINEHFTDYDLVASNTTLPSELALLLNNADVLLIPEQEITLTSVNLTMASVIQEFVSEGGWLIRCGTGSGALINAISIFNVTGISNSSSGTQIIQAASSPLLVGVSAPIYNQNATIYGNFSNSDFNEVTSYDSKTVIGDMDYGSGKAIYIGYDYFNYDTDASKIIANAFQWAFDSRVTWTNANIEETTLAAGDSSIIEITINSNDLDFGIYTADYLFPTNDPTQPEAIYTVNLLVEDLPCIDFSFESESSCNGLHSFTNYTSNASSYEWNFGDGNSSVDENPTHIYAEPGAYTVQLIAFNSNGSDTITQTVFAEFYAISFMHAGLLNVNEEIQFVQIGSTTTNWTWFFGDASASTLPNPMHVYEEPGDYIVTLTGMNYLGCNFTYTDTLHIDGPVNIAEIQRVNYDVFPNPNFGSFTIKSLGQGDEVMIQLTNKIGQIVYSNKQYIAKNGEVKIENLDFAPGIYMLELATGDSKEYIKVIID
jgi:Zn-dependent metalloprotease